MNQIEWLKNTAHQIGIEAIGFCDAEPFLHELKNIGQNDSLEIYKNDESNYKFKSFIGILLSYQVEVDLHDKFAESNGNTLNTSKPYGYVSPSSIFEDYHRLVRDQLAELAGAIESTYGAKNIVYCDQSPFKDREIGRACGLGYIGKNCFLIHPTLGTRTYVGYLLTEMDFDSTSSEHIDEQTTDFNGYKGKDLFSDAVVKSCGNCQLCVVNCPGQALLGVGTIDVDRCVSALTQRKNLDEDWMEEALGKQLYGCDICQSVCPKNRLNHEHCKSRSPIIPQEVDIERLLSISNAEFKATFVKSSAGWIGKKRLQRNARIVLKNIGTEEAMALLKNYPGTN